MRRPLFALISLSAIFAGCQPKPELVAPEVLVSPYGVSTDQRVWAVAPLNNESGTSAVDALMVTDAVVARASEIRGVTTVPLNRTIAAMRALRMNAVRSPQDARRLAQAMGVDGLVVGSITAYDPYDPPTLGLMLGLFSNDRSGDNGIDPKQLRGAGADTPVRTPNDTPSAMVAEHLDARNHEVLMNLQRFAAGRSDERSALGWRSYTASMELYTEFAAYWSVYRLIQEERLRTVRTDRPIARATLDAR
ncbi:MAG: hypothetical protein AB7K52_08565 [Phycisphaerales bacterium]